MPLSKPSAENKAESAPEVEVSVGPATVKFHPTPMVISITALVLALAIYGLAFGAFPFYAGFASATETRQTFDDRLKMIEGLGGRIDKGLDDAKRQIETVRDDIVKSQRLVLSRIVAGNIIAQQMRYCEAVRTSKQAEADLYNVAIADLQNEYASYTGNGYPLRPC